MPQFKNDVPTPYTKAYSRIRSWPYPLAVIIFIFGLAMSLLFWEKGNDAKQAIAPAPQEQAQQQEEEPKVEEQPSATGTTDVLPTVQKPKDRSGLARIVSPDGAWRLTTETAGSPDISVEHSLVLRKTSGTGKTTLISVVDDLDPQKPDIALHLWEAAGWSPDGSTVYYVNRVLGLGMGIEEFAPAVFGNELHAVNVKTAKDTLIGSFSTETDTQKNGIVAVSPASMRVAFLENGSLFTAAFDGSAKRSVYEVKNGQEIWQAMYDPAGAKLAILIRDPKEEGDDVWTVGLVDGKGGFESLGASIVGGLLDWTKGEGLAYLAMHADGGFTEERASDAK